MKVLKFGGTSVGSPERMKSVSKLITDGTQQIVVLSAMSGTTNNLVEIADYYKKGKTTPEQIGPKYASSSKWAQKVNNYIKLLKKG